tara:strand:+ start:1818 stop:2369 length:552 start_codon:yes stop_codon:yes gene_type:complete
LHHVLAGAPAVLHREDVTNEHNLKQQREQQHEVFRRVGNVGEEHPSCDDNVKHQQERFAQVPSNVHGANAIQGLEALQIHVCKIVEQDVYNTCDQMVHYFILSKHIIFPYLCEKLLQCFPCALQSLRGQSPVQSVRVLNLKEHLQRGVLRHPFALERDGLFVDYDFICRGGVYDDFLSTGMFY